jgi:hypothetical protein
VVTRRAALAAGLVALAGCGEEDGAPRVPDDAVLSDLLALELTLAAACASADVQRAQRPLVDDIAARHREHARRLEAVPRVAAAGPGMTPPAAATARALAELERGAVRDYADALPKLAAHDLRGLAADLMAGDAQHLSLLLDASGADPLPDAFGGIA